jgi:hypothetical protein
MAICEACGKWKAAQNVDGYELCQGCFDIWYDSPTSDKKWNLNPVEFLQTKKSNIGATKIFGDSILGGILNFGVIEKKEEKKPKQSYWPF